MADTKFTPEPWRWEKDEHGNIVGLSPAVMSAGPEEINVWNKDDEHLIKTAPELYRTLELAYNQLCKVSLMGTDTIMVLEMIEDTMDKARGEF